MKPVRSLAAVALGAALALPVQAAEPMGADAFERFVTGKTLWFDQDGVTYGVERYLPGRRVEWSFLDGECRAGTWYEDAGQICFLYEDGLGPQCWAFSRDGEGLTARFAGDENGVSLYGAQQRDEEMQCLGPDVGV